MRGGGQCSGVCDDQLQGIAPRCIRPSGEYPRVTYPWAVPLRAAAGVTMTARPLHVWQSQVRRTVWVSFSVPFGRVLCVVFMSHSVQSHAVVSKGLRRPKLQCVTVGWSHEVSTSPVERLRRRVLSQSEIPDSDVIQRSRTDATTRRIHRTIPVVVVRHDQAVAQRIEDRPSADMRKAPRLPTRGDGAWVARSARKPGPCGWAAKRLAWSPLSRPRRWVRCACPRRRRAACRG